MTYSVYKYVRGASTCESLYCAEVCYDIDKVTDSTFSRRIDAERRRLEIIEKELAFKGEGFLPEIIIKDLL